MEQKIQSAHQIGDKVNIFSDSRKHQFDGIVTAVIFATAKVYYDVDVDGILIKDLDSANVEKM